MTLLLCLLGAVGYWLVGTIVYGVWHRAQRGATYSDHELQAFGSVLWPVSAVVCLLLAAVGLVVAIPAWLGKRAGPWLVNAIADYPARRRAAAEVRRKKREAQEAEGVREKPYR